MYNMYNIIIYKIKSYLLKLKSCIATHPRALLTCFPAMADFSSAGRVLTPTRVKHNLVSRGKEHNVTSPNCNLVIKTIRI